MRFAYADPPYPGMSDFYADHPDFVAEPITLKRGLTGAKPERVCMWLFDCLGAQPDDQMDDLYPGSGAVSRAWERFKATPRLDFPEAENELGGRGVISFPEPLAAEAPKPEGSSVRLGAERSERK